MADSAQHSHHEGRDGVPEAAAATITTDASDPSSAPSTHHPYSRPVRSSTHVDIGFFDPAGVSELSRTLSQQGAGESSRADRSDRNNSPSATSDFTIIPTDEPFDLEKTLRNVIKKLDESEIKRRELGVVFKDLCVLGTRAPFAHQPTVGSMANPLNAFKLLWRMRRPHTRNLLSGFEGVLRPGEMLLVLGRPGAGCSTLLRIIANQREGFHAVVGDVHYDSFTPEEIHKHYRGDVQYCPEEDIHFPTLTVEQTLRFAARTRTPETRISAMSRKRHIDMCVEVLLTVFGLRNVKNSLVGDASIRGISGGEKKRVSITEALATRSRLTAWDNSTRGLDASTALEFIRALRIATDIGRVSTVVAAYQAGESLYELFDKVCLINEGRMVYYGPANRARQYFIDMGYEPASRQTTSDFLVADYFLKSELGQINRDDMNSYDEEFASKPTRASAYKESALAEHARHTNPKSPYIISISMQARALMTRRMQIIKGVMAPQIIRTGTFIFLAIIVGTVFLRLKPTTITFFSRGGVLFFALMFSALTAMAEIPALFSQRPIVLRHSKAAMYHPFVEALALTLVDLPITFVTMVIFSIILYFLVGLQQTASQFFIFLLLILTLAVTMKAWFRALAAAFQRPAPAQTIAGISVMILVLYTGYPLPQPYMIGALKWLSWLDPLRYAFEGLLVNEFHNLDATCSELIPEGPAYLNVSITNQVCTTVGSLPGQALVTGTRYALLSFGYAYSHLWRNFGIVCGFAALFIGALLLLTEINTGYPGESNEVAFKRGTMSTLPNPKTGVVDEEKGGSNGLALTNTTESTVARRTFNDHVGKVSETFSFQNICYTVPMGGGAERRLLDDVSGYVVPGKLLALVGESGAGKTTLLNVLAHRVKIGVITGDCYLGGNPLPSDFQAQAGYCQQMDVHLPAASVREALLFSAKLRQPRSVSAAEREAYVELCLKMCGLAKYADAIVGTLNIEFRKRTTIAVELVAKPSLIFVDEPTTGLDSRSAWAILQFLRELADHGQAIVCTIHQPSAELFQTFDSLLLLRKGGQTVYYGDLGHNCSTLLSYFERNGARHCGDRENPAEYMLEVVGAGATATTTMDWHEIWAGSPEAQKVQANLDNLLVDGRKHPPVEAKSEEKYATTWGYQLTTLLQRNFQSHWRDPTYIAAKLALNVVGGLLVGFTFFKSKYTIQGTQNQLFAIFISTVQSIALAHQLEVAFLEMRSIYEIRERYSRMYSWTALVTAQLLVEVPWNILGSSLFFLCWYWTVGFPTSRGGFVYFMLGIVWPLYYTTIGEAVAAMSPDAEIAGLIFGFLVSFIIIFNGVLQPFRLLGWWKWMYHVSPFTYLIEALLGEATGRANITCSAVELVTIEPPSGQTCLQYMEPFISTAGGYITNPTDTASCHYCFFATTDAFLETNFNILYSHHWRDFGLLFVYIGFNTFATYFFTYIFRIRTESYLHRLWRRAAARMASKQPKPEPDAS